MIYQVLSKLLSGLPLKNPNVVIWHPASKKNLVFLLTMTTMTMKMTMLSMRTLVIPLRKRVALQLPWHPQEPKEIMHQDLQPDFCAVKYQATPKTVILIPHYLLQFHQHLVDRAIAHLPLRPNILVHLHHLLQLFLGFMGIKVVSIFLHLLHQSIPCPRHIRRTRLNLCHPLRQPHYLP